MTCGVVVFPTRSGYFYVPSNMVFQIVRATLWISIRYIFKIWDHCKEGPHHKIKQLCKDAPNKESSNVENNDLRLPMELVLMIIQYLHHTDLVNLGLSSKYLRTSFFGSDEPAQVAKDLRRFACKDEGPIRYCAVCNIPTCQVGNQRPFYHPLVNSFTYPDTFPTGLPSFKTSSRFRHVHAPDPLPRSMFRMLFLELLRQPQQTGSRRQARLGEGKPWRAA